MLAYMLGFAAMMIALAVWAIALRKDTGEVIFKASGHSVEEMQPAVVDLRELAGQEIFVRVIDHGRPVGRM